MYVQVVSASESCGRLQTRLGSRSAVGFFIGKQGECIKRIQAQRAPRQRHAVTHSSLFSFLSAGTDGCHCGREPKTLRRPSLHAIGPWRRPGHRPRDEGLRVRLPQMSRCLLPKTPLRYSMIRIMDGLGAFRERESQSENPASPRPGLREASEMVKYRPPVGSSGSLFSLPPSFTLSRSLSVLGGWTK